MTQATPQERSECRSAAVERSAPPDRVILHVDMDAFFASVEVLDDPSLAGLPVIVGGSGARGVVAACTYEARRYGVHSAMPSSVARRRCPQAVFLDGRFHRYMEESRRLHTVLSSFTPLVEGISLDEAFLDVTGSVHLLGGGPTVAHAIRRRVQEELGLACSVGVARSKLMAKLASKAAKPVAGADGITPGPGVFVVDPADELSFLHPMAVRALWGIGPVTERRLHALGITTVGELASVPASSLERYLGPTTGGHLAALARGEDSRPVVPEQAAKSIGHEETFATDLWDRADLHRRLQRMVDAAATALRASGKAARTVTVKLRFGDFGQVTRSHTLDSPIDTGPAIGVVAAALVDSVERDRGVRLLGVSLSGLVEPAGGTQLRLALGLGGEAPAAGGSGREIDPVDAMVAAHEDAERLQGSWSAVSAAVDTIRARYGGESVGPASLVGADGLQVRRRGEAQWGPAGPGSGKTGPPDPGAL